MPASSNSAIAGTICSCSSLPNSPLSPACGLSASTAIRGLDIRMSRFRLLWNILTFSTIASLVMAFATSLMGRCVVTNATRRLPFISIISALLPSPTQSSMYSVWPQKRNMSLCMLFLLIGAVTSTSYLSERKSVMARSSALRAASPASGEGCPISILTSSSNVVNRFTRPSLASSAVFMMLKLDCRLSAFL